MNFPRLPLLLLTTLLLLAPSHGAIYTESMLSMNSTPKVKEFQERIKIECNYDKRSNSCTFLGKKLSFGAVDDVLYYYLTKGNNAILAFYLENAIKKELADYGIKVDDLLENKNKEYDTKKVFKIYLASHNDSQNGQSAASSFSADASALIVYIGGYHDIKMALDLKATLAHEMGHQLILQNYTHLRSATNTAYVVHESFATYIKYLYYQQATRQNISMIDFIRSSIAMDNSNMISQYQPAPNSGEYKVSIPYMAAFVSTLDIIDGKVRPNTNMLAEADKLIQETKNACTPMPVYLQHAEKIRDLNKSDDNRSSFFDLITSGRFAKHLQNGNNAELRGTIDDFINNLQ